MKDTTSAILQIQFPFLGMRKVQIYNLVQISILLCAKHSRKLGALRECVKPL